MRWLPFAILAYVFVGLQLGLGSVAGGIWMPNLVLLAVLFVALHARPEQAMLGCFILGVGHDVIGDQGLGTYAFFYGMVGYSTVKLRAVMYREHPLTHLTLAALMGVSIGLLLSFRSSLRQYLGNESSDFYFWQSLAGVVTTTLLAPVVIMSLRSLRSMFGFKPG